MESLRICFTAIMPLFVYLGAGYLARCIKQIRDEDVLRFNKIVFNFFLTVNQFKSIYFSDINAAIRPKLILFSVGGVLLSAGLALLVSVRLLPKRDQRGVMIQAVFRSNFILVGLYIAGNLVPYEDTASVAVLCAIIIPLYTVLSVIALSVYSGEKISAGKILRKIATNPLIVASLLGILWLGPMPRLPEFLENSVQQMGAVATPMMLFLLGGFFHFESLGRYRKPVILGAAMKLVVIPTIFLPIAYALGFRGVEFAALIGLFASSTSVSSFTMTNQIGGDAELAGDLVVVTSIFSILTLFGWSLLFRLLGAY